MWANDCQVYTDYLHLEHKQIHDALRGIKRTALSSDRPALATELKRLRGLLVRHFEQEEDGGCLEQAACCSPRLSAAVNEIAGTHQSLLQQLDRLIENRPSDAANVATFVQLLEEFSGRLSAHDVAENEVLQQAFESG